MLLGAALSRCQTEVVKKYSRVRPLWGMWSTSSPWPNRAWFLLPYAVTCSRTDSMFAPSLSHSVPVSSRISSQRNELASNSRLRDGVWVSPGYTCCLDSVLPTFPPCPLLHWPYLLMVSPQTPHCPCLPPLYLPAIFPPWSLDSHCSLSGKSPLSLVTFLVSPSLFPPLSPSHSLTLIVSLTCYLFL